VAATGRLVKYGLGIVENAKAVLAKPPGSMQKLVDTKAFEEYEKLVSCRTAFNLKFGQVQMCLVLWMLSISPMLIL
jgi:hypothetical protein